MDRRWLEVYMYDRCACMLGVCMYVTCVHACYVCAYMLVMCIYIRFRTYVRCVHVRSTIEMTMHL